MTTDIVQRKINDFLNDFYTYITQKKHKKAKNSVKSALQIYNKYSDYPNYAQNPSFSKFTANAFLKAAEIADKQNSPETAKYLLKAGINSAGKLKPKSMQEKEFNRILDYIKTEGKKGDIQNINIPGVTYSTKEAQGIRFDTEDVRRNYLKRLEEKSEQEIKKTADNIWKKIE